jgi:hypothetical protein
MAVASGVDPSATQKIMAVAASVENAAAVGAAWGSVLGPQGAAIGAIVGVVIGIVENLPWAHPDNTDTRPVIVQLWEKGLTPVSSDLQVQAQARALAKLVSDRYAYLVNPTCDPNISVFCTRLGTLGNDIASLFAQWDVNGVGLGSDALHRFDSWTLRPCNNTPIAGAYPGPGINVAVPPIGMPDIGMCAPGAVGNVTVQDVSYGTIVDFATPAVLVWSNQQMYAYLIGLRLLLKKYEEAYNLQTDPTTEIFRQRLNEAVGWVAAKVPALNNNPNNTIFQWGGGAFAPPPLPNLVGPSSTIPMSTSSKVALGIGGTVVAVAGGSWLYNNLTKQGYSCFCSRIWQKTGSRAWRASCGRAIKLIK